MKSPIIIALDFADPRQAYTFAQQFQGQPCHLKVGKELFTRGGPDLVNSLIQLGFNLFLDLKYHDIPNTVAKACVAAADLGVWMLTVHALGGRAMLSAARTALDTHPTPPLIVAVTLLTSLENSDLPDIGLSGQIEDNVVRLATLAHDCQLDGIVCSPQEITLIRNHLGNSFTLITPGIRPATTAHEDQKRVLTPHQAILLGTDYLVIGRPITAAPNPLASFLAIQHSLFQPE